MPHVGGCIGAALEHAALHERTATRKLRVRVQVGPERDGLLVSATYAARTGEELAAQIDTGRRLIAWADLDAQAPNLPAIIDQCVAEASAAIQLEDGSWT